MKLAAKIIRVLGTALLPVPTPDLVALCGPGGPNDRGAVWTELARMHRLGVVAKTHRRTPKGGRGSNNRVAVWRLRKAVRS